MKTTITVIYAKRARRAPKKERFSNTDKIILKPAPIPNTVSDFIRIPFAENLSALPSTFNAIFLKKYDIM